MKPWLAWTILLCRPGCLELTESNLPLPLNFCYTTMLVCKNGTNVRNTLMQGFHEEERNLYPKAAEDIS